MAKLSAHGQKVLQYSKERPGDGQLTDWERTTIAWMSDGRVLKKLDVNFKGENRFGPSRHSYGWKLWMRVKNPTPAKVAELAAAARNKAAGLGWTVEVDRARAAA